MKRFLISIMLFLSLPIFSEVVYDSIWKIQIFDRPLLEIDYAEFYKIGDSKDTLVWEFGRCSDNWNLIIYITPDSYIKYSDEDGITWYTFAEIVEYKRSSYLLLETAKGKLISIERIPNEE